MVTELEQALRSAPEEPEAEPGATADASSEPAEVAGEPGDAQDPSTLDELIGRHEWLRDALSARDRERENAGGQRREAQLKREAGSREQTRQGTAAWMRAQGIDPDEAIQLDNGQSWRRAEFMYDLARANTATEIVRDLPQHLLDKYTIPPEVREEAARVFDTPIDADGTRDHLGYLQTLLSGALDAQDKARESKLRKELEQEYKRKFDDEVKALRAEQTPQPAGAPNVPRGSAPDVLKIPYHELTSQQRAAMSPTERDAAIAAYR